jgi:hypothetical protein
VKLNTKAWLTLQQKYHGLDIYYVIWEFLFSICPLLKFDNQSAIAIPSNHVFHSKIKHLDNDFHFIREKVQMHDLQLEYVSSDEQVADIFTKRLSSPLFGSHCLHQTSLLSFVRVTLYQAQACYHA